MSTSGIGFAPVEGVEWAPGEGQTVRRIGVVDVGSNSVRLVVFDGVARSPTYFYNEKILCGLGAGLQETGVLNPEGRERALTAIRRFVALSKLMGLSQLTGVATAAVREASDGRDFAKDVATETGLKLQIATGQEEAMLAAKGVLFGWPQATGVVCDIGGASMELARVDYGQIGRRETSPLGPLRLANLGSEKKVDKEIARGVDALVDAIGKRAKRIYLVGGSWRAVARLDMERRDYPLKVLHEYRMSPEQAVETCDWITGQAPADLATITDTSLARLELVPLAARVLARLVRRMKPEALSVSSYGLREGMLYELMPESLLNMDPLIEAASHMERVRARFPGFGLSLYNWLAPLYHQAGPSDLRLIRAACHLHDITWRAHPDYRAEVCFETVTRANLSGLDHEGRVFLGIAILNRYKNASRSTFAPAMVSLLTDDRLRQAEVLGRAIRLGAMISGAAPGSLENTELDVDGDRLRLTLRGPAQALRGEVVDRRLAALASRLDLTPELTLA